MNSDFHPRSEWPIRWLNHMKIIRAYLLCYPLALLASLYATWLAGRIALGYWPRPSLDDPKFISVWVDIPYFIHGLLLVVGLPVFIMSVLFLLYRAIFDERRRSALLLFAAFSITYMFFTIVVIRWEPLLVANWYMD